MFLAATKASVEPSPHNAGWQKRLSDVFPDGFVLIDDDFLDNSVAMHSLVVPTGGNFQLHVSVLTSSNLQSCCSSRLSSHEFQPPKTALLCEAGYQANI